MDAGQSLLISLLDYDGSNPVTRILRKKSVDENLLKVIDRIRDDFKKDNKKSGLSDLKK